jgi:hypothetical protein
VRVAAAGLGSLLLFGAPVALQLWDPDAAFAILAAALLCVLVVPFVRVDLTPWLVAPPLAAVALVSVSGPGEFVPALAGVVLCALLYGVVLVVRLTLLRHTQPPSRAVTGVWAGTAVLGVAVFLVARTALPLELRFRVSEEAMTDAARAVIEGRRDPREIERIGTWKVVKAERLPGGMRFLVEGSGLFGRHGFHYPTDGLHQPYARYLGDGWFTWSEDDEP